MNIQRVIGSLSGQQILLIMIGGIVFIGATFQVIEAKPAFCKTCHEMEYHYDTWTTSTHHEKADCLNCHTEPGVRGFIDAKVRALTELIAHITGKYEVPIRSNVRVNDQQCLSCHPDAESIPDVAVDVRHDLHMENSVLCADCHSRIVHADVDEPKVIQARQCDECHNSHGDFPIQEKHALLRCSECHPDGVYEAVSSLCQDCHEVPPDHVEGVYSNCEACHSDSGWDVIGYDHVTISLRGGHGELECLDCHEPESYSGLSPSCESCHDLPDPHVLTEDQTCIECHTVNSWSPADYDHSFYGLTGGHSTVTCKECHTEGQYEGTSIICEDCHNAPIDHALDIDETCDLCHIVEGWTSVTYDHQNFPLTEGHTDVPCIDCHIDRAYETTSNLCEDCHEAPTNHAVEIDTECIACHTTAGWTPATFDHESYPLTGAHTDVTCSECHTGGVYTGTPTECIDCHSIPAYHSGLPDCAQCHTTATFSTSTYRHPYIEEHYPRGEKQLSCITCHPTTYSRYTCTGSGCHSSNHPRDD